MTDVARRANVSTATVSRALTQPDKVNPETLHLIHKIAAEMGFRPNLLGRQLRVGAAKTLLILVQDLSNPFFPELIKGAQAAALAHQYSIIVGDTDYLENQEKLIVELFLGGRVDGLIMSIGHLPVGLSAELATRSPVVLVSERIPDLDLPSVLTDNARWARIAVEHLITHGHKRIAHIAGKASHSTARERSCGYRDALQAAGLPIHPDYETEADFTYASGRKAAARLLSMEPRPTAIFCASDESALGAIRGAQDVGLSVPKDVSIVGFDDSMLAGMATPPLTTIRQPRRDIGAAAVELAINMIDNQPHAQRHVQVDCTLIERESVAWCREE